MNKNIVKIVLLGDGRVGKTSILNRFISNSFNEKEDMTINSCYFEKEIEYKGEKISVCLWDTAGQEKFNALAPIYYRDAKGAILVYDVSVADTFKRVRKWVAELRDFNKNTIIAVAGNKIDLKIHFENEKEEVMKYLEEQKIKLFYTSAKTGEGLDEIFEYISKEVSESIINKLNAGQSNTKSGAKKLQVSKGGPNLNSQKDGGCCK